MTSTAERYEAVLSVPTALLVRRLARRPAAKWAACTVHQLRPLAEVLQTPKTGRKARIAQAIHDRLDAIDRALEVGDDPLELARRFSKRGLLVLAYPLGAWLGSNKYGLAAQVIGKRDFYLKRLEEALRAEAEEATA